MRKLVLIAVLLLPGCGTTDSNLANQPGADPAPQSPLQQFMSETRRGLNLIFSDLTGPHDF
jgi:hypothetical protein